MVAAHCSSYYEPLNNIKNDAGIVENGDIMNERSAHSRNKCIALEIDAYENFDIKHSKPENVTCGVYPTSTSSDGISLGLLFL